MTGRSAVFLDRDGTIIRDTNYVARPEQVELLPGVAEAIARLNRGGVPVIIVTNQSGIARGILTHDDFEQVQARMLELLDAERATITATYVCPHSPGADGELLCRCRKPGALLFEQAADAHQVDLAQSFFAGDKWRDVAPALAFGGTGVLIPQAPTSEEDRGRALVDACMVQSLGELADLVLASG